MEINRNNCEAYFLDYYEGRLSPEQAEQLFAFLDEHPDLHEIFNSYESITLDDERAVNFLDKEKLKRFADLPRTVNEANCSEFFIAAAEGLLTEEEEQRLAQFLASHPERQAEYDLFLQTRLAPETVVFEHKAALKKTAEPVSEKNYEDYIIQAIEGLLQAQQLKELEAFLAAHPALAAVYAQYQQTRLQPEPIVFEHKAALKKQAEPVTAANCEERMLLAIEGLLNTQQLQELEAFLALNPDYAAMFAQYQLTRLQPDLSVVYEDKASLKRRAGGFVVRPVWRAAAALVVLLVAGYGISRLVNGGAADGSGIAFNDSLNNRKAIPVVVPDHKDTNSNGAPSGYASNTTNPQIHPQDTAKPVVRENFIAFQQPVIKTIEQGQDDPAALALVGNNGSGGRTTTQQAYPEYSYPTVREIAQDWALEKLGGKPAEPATGVMAMRDQKESLTGWDWTGLVMKKVTGEKITLEKSGEQGGRVLNVNLGKLHFSHKFGK